MLMLMLVGGDLSGKYRGCRSNVMGRPCMLWRCGHGGSSEQAVR